MTLLFNEAHPIPLHAIIAMIAIILGGIQLSMKKGGAIHKLLGRIWAVSYTHLTLPTICSV